MVSIRPALASDIPALRRLISRSVEQLQAADYDAAQRRAALGTIFGIDSQLIQDQTYYVAEVGEELAACGGWSYRSTLFGADAHKTQPDSELQPGTDAARIRAFFVAPAFARQGLGSRIIHHCEDQAKLQGFRAFELGSTLSGERFYLRHGYREIERVWVPLAKADPLAIIRMRKP